MTAMKNVADSEGLKGRTVALSGLVGYQDGAIVSREIASLPTGTMTVFAFDAGEQLSEHTAPFDATVIGLEGEAEVRLGGETHRVKAGEMIVMPAGLPHALRAETRFKMLLVMIKKPA
jgi:quercetin dioxygenase-like cupin family protein